MSTEIERYQERDVVDGWSDRMSDVVKLAEYVAETDFIPKALRNKPAAIAAAILAGREAGVPPMRALSHMHIVEGRPSMSAEQKRAQALAAGHEIVYVESTTERCIVKGRRANSENWSTITWTKDDARAAGLLGRANWKNYPRRMLQARATGELCDALFADATAGLATFEELVDDSDSVGIETDNDTPPAKGRKAKRRSSVKKASEPKAINVASSEQPAEPPTPPQPPLPGEEGYDKTTGNPPAQQTPSDSAGQALSRETGDHRQVGPDAATSAPEGEPPVGPAPDKPVTDAQKKKTMALFTNLGITDRQQRLDLTSTVINRSVSSAKELSSDEAGALIDTLEAALNEADPFAWLSELVDSVQRARAEYDDDERPF